MKLQTKYMTRNDCYTAGRKITPKGIMVHSTATPGVMAARWFDLWNKSYKAGEITRQACVHAFLDDKEVWQYLPWNHRGWHGGGSVNDTHVSFEICEPAGHRYAGGATMIDYDVKKNEAYFRAAWSNAVALCVLLCKTYNLNETHIIDHYEGYRRGVASNSGDVQHWFPKHGESMNTFRAAVKTALGGASVPAPAPNIPQKPEENNVTQETFNKMFAVAMAAYHKEQSAQPPSGWAKENWEKMCAIGMFDGSSPRGSLTREQMATLCTRLDKVL